MARKRKKKSKMLIEDLDQPEEPNPFDGLAESPRAVSGRLRLHLLLTPVTVVGCLVIGIVGLFLPSSLALKMPMNPFATPAWSKVEGELDRIDRKFVDVPSGPQGRLRSKQLRYYYHYHFRLDDSRVLSSQSYRLKAIHPALRPKSKVIIEYDPTRPEVSRLEGTSVDLPISPALPLLILLVIAVVVVGCSLWFGFRRIDLLRRGQPGWAFLTTVKVQQDKQTIDLPLDEFKQQLQASLKETAHQRPYVVLFWVFGGFWGMMAGFFGAFFGLGTLLLWHWAFGGAVEGRNVAILVATGFLAGFSFVILGPMRWRRRRWLDQEAGIGPPRPLPRQDFGYVFETEAGEVVEGHAVVRLTTLDEEPAQPVLYDLSKPRRSLLLQSLTPEPTVSDGGWAAPIGKGVFIRLALVVASLVVAPLIGCWFAFH
jgi:hypothetical protein